MARPSKLSELQRERLRSVARGHTTAELAAWCERELGIAYSVSSVNRLLPRLGLRLLPNSKWVEATR